MIFLFNWLNPDVEGPASSDEIIDISAFWIRNEFVFAICNTSIQKMVSVVALKQHFIDLINLHLIVSYLLLVLYLMLLPTAVESEWCHHPINHETAHLCTFMIYCPSHWNHRFWGHHLSDFFCLWSMFTTWFYLLIKKIFQLPFL